MLLLVPQLPTVYEVLPQDVGTWRNGGEGIEEGQREPDADNGVLLSESLSGTNAVTPMAAYCLADGELHEAYEERSDKEHPQNPSRYGAVLYVADGEACYYGEVEAPDVEADVLAGVQLVANGRKESACQLRKDEWHDEHQRNAAQQHEHRHEEGDVRLTLHEWEEDWYDDHRDHVGYDGEDCQ